MDREQQLDRLIQRLLQVTPQALTIAEPDSYQEKRRLLRGLMNLSPPVPMPGSFLEEQDIFLSREREEKTITDAMALPVVSLHPQLSLWRGDITSLQVDAIVNAANAGLLGCFIPCHACIDNAIHSAAGLQLRLFCHEIMEQQGHPEPTGEAKLTRGYNLPARYVLHTVGPIIRGPLTEEDCRLLASCYRSCLELAEENGLQSMAFCCISTGEFHFPPERAAEIAVETVTGFLSEARGLQRVVFNVFSERDMNIYRGLLGEDQG